MIVSVFLNFFKRAVHGFECFLEVFRGFLMVLRTLGEFLFGLSYYSMAFGELDFLGKSKR